MMHCKGTVKGNVIELDEPLPLRERTRVEVTIEPETKPCRNSPQAWLQLAGSLSEDEAEVILRFVKEQVRRIDWEMWQEPMP